MYTSKATRSAVTPVGTLTSTVTVTSDGLEPRQVIIPATTVQEITIAFTRAKMKMFAAKASGDLTLKTNSSGAPDDTVVLKAGIPRIWTDQDPAEDNPILNADVTKIFADNDGALEVTLDLVVPLDSTP